MSRTTEALASALVRHAARTAPRSLSARLEEEWLADLQERSAAWPRLRFAIGCFRASIAIGLEHTPERATVPVASTGQGGAPIWLEAPGFFSSRAALFALVLSLHAAVLCGLLLVGTKLWKPTEPPALQPRIIDPVASPKIEPPRPEIKPIIDDRLLPRTVDELPPIQPDPPQVIPESRGRDPAPPLVTSTSPPSRSVTRILGRTGPSFPHPSDFYPDASIRAGEEGAAVLNVCVDAAGRLTADPVTSESSGRARLDAAALRLARAGSGRYLPTTEDGRPVASCYPIKIRFQIR
jgi:TonB family protein